MVPRLLRSRSTRATRSRPAEALDELGDQLAELIDARFDGERGRRFLIGTVVQTLFYGMFSAWVLWHNERPDRDDDFAWRDAADNLRMPLLRGALPPCLPADDTQSPSLRDLLDCERLACFRACGVRGSSHAFRSRPRPSSTSTSPSSRRSTRNCARIRRLVHAARDRALHGGRVDRALRENSASPMASPIRTVIVLDPCCGTGAFPRRGACGASGRTLERRHGPGRAETQARLSRSTAYGFELLPAPYVVAHLQIGLALKRWGASLRHEGRAAERLC